MYFCPSQLPRRDIHQTDSTEQQNMAVHHFLSRAFRALPRRTFGARFARKRLPFPVFALVPRTPSASTAAMAAEPRARTGVPEGGGARGTRRRSSERGGACEKRWRIRLMSATKDLRNFNLRASNRERQCHNHTGLQAEKVCHGGPSNFRGRKPRGEALG